VVGGAFGSAYAASKFGLEGWMEGLAGDQRATGRGAGQLARALVELADSGEPPLRWVAGEDAVDGIAQKARFLLAHVDALHERSTNLAHDDARAAA